MKAFVLCIGLVEEPYRFEQLKLSLLDFAENLSPETLNKGIVEVPDVPFRFKAEVVE